MSTMYIYLRGSQVFLSNSFSKYFYSKLTCVMIFCRSIS